MKPTHAILFFAAFVLSCDRSAATRGPVGMPSSEHVRWVQVDTDAAGRIAKCAVYHDDAARMPDAVLRLADRKFPGAGTRFFETELYAEHGPVYEVVVETREGRHCEIAGRPDGTELYTECSLTRAEVPREVLAAATKLLPQGVLEEAEAKRGPKIDEIDLEMRVGTALHYLRYTPKGELIDHLVRMRGSVHVEDKSKGDPPG